MSSAVEYRELADECLGWARTAKSDKERRIFLQMAEAWLQRGLGPDGPPKTAEYLRFDEIEDVLSSMDLLALVVPLVDEQAGYWKWIIISAHAALQGAMVCVLAATASLAALEKKSAKAMRKYLETEEGQPEEWLATFDTLLTPCRDRKYMSDKPLQLNDAQLDDIIRLNSHFRNEFVHFTPKGWSIERAGLPRMIQAAVDSIEKLMRHPHVLHKLDDDQKERLVIRVKRVRSNL